MTCAGILLTGGASRRMGTDKAAIRFPVDAGADGPTLAERTADLLLRACSPVIEVGPGRSSLPSVIEPAPGSGPLAAIVAGQRSLVESGWHGPVLVVATDLPLLTASMLVWLADHPETRSVVPVRGNRIQPLCARYSPDAMDRAAQLVQRGVRSMSALIDSIDAALVSEDAWATHAGGTSVLDDVDTPEALAALQAGPVETGPVEAGPVEEP